MYDLNDPKQFELELNRRVGDAMRYVTTSGGKARDDIRRFHEHAIRQELELERDAKKKQEEAAGGAHYEGAGDPTGDLGRIRELALKLQSGGYDYNPDYHTVNNMYAGEVGDLMRQFGAGYNGMEGMPRMQASLMAMQPAVNRRRAGYETERQREHESKLKNVQAAISALAAADAGGRGNRTTAFNMDMGRAQQQRSDYDPSRYAPLPGGTSSTDIAKGILDIGKTILTYGTGYTPVWNEATQSYQNKGG